MKARAYSITRDAGELCETLKARVEQRSDIKIESIGVIMGYVLINVEGLESPSGLRFTMLTDDDFTFDEIADLMIKVVTEKRDARLVHDDNGDAVLD